MSDPPPRVDALSRRRFLQLAAAIGVLGVEACAPSPTPTPSATPTATPATTPIADVPFGVWEALRDAVRASPDHLTAAAERIVATKDAERIFAFVRDSIATYPSRATGFAGAETDTRWGIRGTLRGGAGTPREKAALLAQLLVEAGFEAEVVSGRLSSAAKRRQAILYRRIERPFDPSVDLATLDAWESLLSETGQPDPTELDVIDADGAESAALGEALLALLPAAVRAAEPFDWTSLDTIPLVKVVVGGADRFANPLLADATFGESYCDGEPRRAAAAIPARPVTVELQIARSDAPNVRMTVAEGSWPTDELVGRQVAVQFAPAGELSSVVLTPVEQLRSFVPVLSLRGADVDLDTAAESAIVGTVITADGDLLEAAEDGTVSVNGVPLAPGKSDPAAGAAVVSVEVAARADAFPAMRLRLTAIDASGRAVSGLPPTAIRLEEEGTQLGFVLHSNEPPAPRVLLLFDTSDSIPAEFRGQAAVELGRELAGELVAAHATVQLRAAAVDAGLAAARGDWTRDPEALGAGVAALTGFGSDIWSALVDARKLGPTVIVLITDAQATDRPEVTALKKPQVAAGVPVVGVGVGEVDSTILQAIADISGGLATTVQARADAIGAVTRYVGTREAQPYDLTYRAPLDGPTTRTVRVVVGPTSSAEASYTVPSEEERIPPPALVGLYLEVSHGSRRVVRTLAGIDVNRPLGFREPVPPDVIAQVRGALFGSAALSIEGAAPTPAAWFDDLLAARETLRPLWSAAEGTDLDAILEALRGGIVAIPPELVNLHTPLPDAADDRSLTFETGLRAVLIVEQPVFGKGITRRADILPLSDWATAADDPAEAYRLTLTRTARLAIGEAALFETSASSILGRRPTTTIAARTAVPASTPASPWTRLLDTYRDDHRIVPADDGPFAFWSVSATTGRLIGVLPDGSGGGSTAYERTLDEAERLLALLSLAGSYYGAGFAFSAFLALQKAILNQVIREAIMVSAIGTGDCLDPSFNETLKNLACDLGKSALPKVFKTLDTASKYDKLAKILTGKNLKCPKVPVTCL